MNDNVQMVALSNDDVARLTVRQVLRCHVADAQYVVARLHLASI